MIIQQDTHWLLTQWALWAMAGMNSGSISVIARMMEMQGDNYKQTTYYERHSIDDEKAEIVDQTIAKFSKRNSEAAKALKLYYLSKCNTSYTARQLKIKRERVDVLVNSGIAWVDATMEIYRAA